MARGKNTCRILKEIRRQIAEANDIEYVVEECKYKGDCLGTCPKCEAEVQYLESQLHKRQLLGKAVVVAGLSLGFLTANATAPAVDLANDEPQDNVPDKTQEGKYKISGQVIEGETNDPLIGSTVTLEGEGFQTTTYSDLDGKFTIATDVLPAKLTVEFKGFLNYEIIVTEQSYKDIISTVLQEDPDAELMAGIIQKDSTSSTPLLQESLNLPMKIELKIDENAIQGEVVVVGGVCAKKNSIKRLIPRFLRKKKYKK